MAFVKRLIEHYILRERFLTNIQPVQFTVRQNLKQVSFSVHLFFRIPSKNAAYSELYFTAEKTRTSLVCHLYRTFFFFGEKNPANSAYHNQNGMQKSD